MGQVFNKSLKGTQEGSGIIQGKSSKGTKPTLDIPTKMFKRKLLYVLSYLNGEVTDNLTVSVNSKLNFIIILE